MYDFEFFGSMFAMARFQSLCSVLLLGGTMLVSIGAIGFLRCLAASNRPVPLTWLALSDILFFGYGLAFGVSGFVGLLLMGKPFVLFQVKAGIILLLALTVIGALIGLLRASRRIKTWPR